MPTSWNNLCHISSCLEKWWLFFQLKSTNWYDFVIFCLPIKNYTVSYAHEVEKSPMSSLLIKLYSHLFSVDDIVAIKSGPFCWFRYLSEGIFSFHYTIFVHPMGFLVASDPLTPSRICIWSISIVSDLVVLKRALKLWNISEWTKLLRI
jgi:hypothetical protein